MKFRIKRLAKKVLQEHVYEDYGTIITKISKIKYLDKEDVRFEIKKIIREYFPEIEDYDIIIQSSENPHFDYIIRMRKRKRA